MKKKQSLILSRAIVRNFSQFFHKNFKKILYFVIFAFLVIGASQTKYINVIFSQFVSYTIILLSFVVVFRVRGKVILLALLALYGFLAYYTLINNSIVIEQLSQDAFVTFIVAIIFLIKDFRRE